MLKLLLPLLLLLLTALTPVQTDCTRPVIRLLHASQPVLATGSPLLPEVRLEVAPAAGCPEQRYRFRNIELTLLRNGRPVLPTRVVQTAQLDLRSFRQFYATGDQLVLFIAYHNLALVSAEGELTPLRTLREARAASGLLDLRTEDSRGISFRWVLHRP